MAALKHRPSLKDLEDKLRELMPQLADRYQVETLGVFGSYVNPEKRHRGDLDLLVTFREPPGLFKFIELENFLSDTLGVEVDLVMRDALKPEIGERILAEVVRL